MAQESEREKTGYDRMETEMCISKIRDENENMLVVCRKMQCLLRENEYQLAIQKEEALGVE